MSGIFKVFTNVLDTIFGGGEKSTPAPAPVPVPTVEPVTPMPTPDDKAVADAKKRSIAAITARQGRASTILTGDDTALGA